MRSPEGRPGAARGSAAGDGEVSRCVGDDGQRAPSTVVHVMTIPESLVCFLTGQASFMREAGFMLEAIASPGRALQTFGRQEQVPVHAVPMTRRITPVEDLRALWRLWRTLSRIRPQIVHAHTPKGGLLGMLAATLAGVPARVYHMRGLPFTTATGTRRRLLRGVEKVSCRLAHRVLAISHSTRALAVEEGICEPRKIRVVHAGGNGVDASHRFVPGDDTRRSATRSRHGIPDDAPVIGFVGRLARDKGVVDLARAWEHVRQAVPGAHLLVVGSFEKQDSVPAEVVEKLERDGRVHLTGFDPNTPPLYAAMDVVALPSYREGFPNVPMEAAAMALPVVASSIPGCTEAVLDGITGTLVPPRDPTALAAALMRYLADPALRARHGEAGRRRALAEFRREAIWEGIAGEYRSLVEAAGRGGRAPRDRPAPGPAG